MLRLMLLRHAKSDWSAAGQPDRDRPLAQRGRAAAPVMGRYLAQHPPGPDLALVSPARRTRETWDLLAPALASMPPVRFDERLYDARAATVLRVLQEAPVDTRALLVIGHNPGLQELANLVIGTGDPAVRAQLVEKFPTTALAVIDFTAERWSELRAGAGRLERFITPRAMALETD